MDSQMFMKKTKLPKRIRLAPIELPLEILIKHQQMCKEKGITQAFDVRISLLSRVREWEATKDKAA